MSSKDIFQDKKSVAQGLQRFKLGRLGLRAGKTEHYIDLVASDGTEDISQKIKLRIAENRRHLM